LSRVFGLMRNSFKIFQKNYIIKLHYENVNYSTKFYNLNFQLELNLNTFKSKYKSPRVRLVCKTASTVQNSTRKNVTIQGRTTQNKFL